jgi:hypothetical protein
MKESGAGERLCRVMDLVYEGLTGGSCSDHRVPWKRYEVKVWGPRVMVDPKMLTLSTDVLRSTVDHLWGAPENPRCDAPTSSRDQVQLAVALRQKGCLPPSALLILTTSRTSYGKFQKLIFGVVATTSRGGFASETPSEVLHSIGLCCSALGKDPGWLKIFPGSSPFASGSSAAADERIPAWLHTGPQHESAPIALDAVKLTLR